jgi:hypothetical protein
MAARTEFVRTPRHSAAISPENVRVWALGRVSVCGSVPGAGPRGCRRRGGRARATVVVVCDPTAEVVVEVAGAVEPAPDRAAVLVPERAAELVADRVALLVAALPHPAATQAHRSTSQPIAAIRRGRTPRRVSRKPRCAGCEFGKTGDPAA